MQKNRLTAYEFSFMYFHSNSRRLNLLRFYWSTLEAPAIAMGGHLYPYSSRTGGLTDLSRRK